MFDVSDDDRKTSKPIARHVEHVHGAQQAILSRVLIKGARFKNKQTKKQKTSVLHDFFSACLTCVVSVGQLQDEFVGAGQPGHPEHLLIGGLHAVLDVLPH